MTPKICQKCVSGRGSTPDPAALGSSRRSPNLYSRLGKGHPSPDLTPLNAFGALILGPSVLAPQHVRRFDRRAPAQAWCPSAALGLATALSQERLKLLLSANRKSCMPRRLAQERMTASDLEWLFHESRVISSVADLLVRVYLTHIIIF